MDTKTNQKVCYKCKNMRPASEFYKDASRPDGLGSSCKDCRRSFDRAMYYKRKGRTEYILKTRRAAAKQAAKFPEKKRARQLAQAFAHIIKKPKCERCGSGERLDMHHPDYSKPFDVTTLCKPCHRAAHQDTPPQDTNAKFLNMPVIFDGDVPIQDTVKQREESE